MLGSCDDDVQRQCKASYDHSEFAAIAPRPPIARYCTHMRTAGPFHLAFFELHLEPASHLLRGRCTQRLYVSPHRCNALITLAFSPRRPHVQGTGAAAELLSLQQSSLLAHRTVSSTRWPPVRHNTARSHTKTLLQQIVR